VKCAIIVFIAFALLLPSLILADDLQVHDDYLPQYGDFYRPRDGTLQEHNDCVPRYGDYLKRGGDKDSMHPFVKWIEFPNSFG